MTTQSQKPIVPEGSTEFSTEDFQDTDSKVHAIRDKALANSQTATEARDRAVAEIAANVKSLRAVRRARKMTQAQLATTLEISQARLSQIETSTNHQLSTLSRFIAATGGTLRVSAVYPDNEVELDLTRLLGSNTDTENGP